MKTTVIKCPHCGKRGDWFAGPFGPFCSRRCKLLDLGKWFEEEHAISEPLPEPQEQPGTGGAADEGEDENQ